MADPGTTIDRNAERLARMARGEALQRARARRVQRQAKRAGGRAVRAIGVVGAIMLALLLWGLIVGPIGTTVLVLAVLFGAMAAMAAAIWDGPDAEPEWREDAPPAVLPAATDVWLDRQRRNLPALAAPQVDAISARLATLETQLARVPAGDPVAQDLSRLLGKHLPELVERYTRVPSEQRARTIEADGRSLDTTLVDGLRVVEEELARASDSLAAADRDAVRIQGKFLEARYKDGDGAVK
ncbi:hypothetical protein [Polymorphobacter fuscus]|uniref:Uncharacterized protein n=1 Tax=Sandarakinorhabdus fusca TaxID=1439888 RepID=A0A7C9KXP8_9SPHN|nr:hypothetical protein [Polymorphobacter fuscus]KAB7645614.1 hypothetical protein F9290_12440 [Polymorphobacter fuscus]MQT18065.1 hypothetical protein [Polymorphobacter fuscus]NJC08698.1 hypothetical protein [Polymorphobacter fuscus]